MIQILDWLWNDDAIGVTITKARIVDQNGYTWEFNTKNSRQLDIVYDPPEDRPSWSGYVCHNFEQALLELQIMGYIGLED